MPRKSAVPVEQTIMHEDATLETSAMILAPEDNPDLPHYRPRFGEGGVIESTGVMESGKSVLIYLSVFELLINHGYDRRRVFGNGYLDLPGYHHLCNSELKKVLHRAYGRDSHELGKWTGCIFIIMESDSLYSHRDSGIASRGKEDGTADLWNLSQSMRFNNYLFYEYHEGLGVLKFLRDKTEISLTPKLDVKHDHMDVEICNGHYNNYFLKTIDNVSWVYPKYRRFKAIV